MIDINYIKENRARFLQQMSKRPGFDASDIDLAIELDSSRRQTISLIETLKQAKNQKSKLISLIKDRASNKQYEILYADIQHINQKLDELNCIKNTNEELDSVLSKIPNILDEDVPTGKDESDNKVIYLHESSMPNRTLDIDHSMIGYDLNMISFEAAAKMSGSRFVILMRDIARLERALMNFMLDVHTSEFGFTEVVPPYLVKEDAMYRAGQLPKFAEDSFLTTDGFRLIPTAEVPLVNLVQDLIIPVGEFPLRFVAHTPCFRSEAGSAGRDTKGMIRLHQFSKVELVSVTCEKTSKNEHEFLLNASQEILKRLDLPYRVMLLCSGDTGFCSSRTYDIEVWIPSQNKYREIASCSNCTDFQARRLKTRYKNPESKKNSFAHTLNSSALPTGRSLVAIIENYYNELDNTITIPDVLVPYMNGQKEIKAAKKSCINS